MDRAKGEDGKDIAAGPGRWPTRFVPLIKPLGAVILVVGFVLWAHVGSGIARFHSQVKSAPGWDRFRDAYGLDSFGEDSYFVRAAQNGYNLFYFTHRSGWLYDPAVRDLRILARSVAHHLQLGEGARRGGS
jgi:hypothetical protein